MYNTEALPHLTSLSLNMINFDNNFIIKHSETSDTRPYTTPSLVSEPLFDEYNPPILQHYTRKNILHPNRNDTTELFQNHKFPLFNIIPNPQQVTTKIHNLPDPSETATIQNVSKLSEETTNNHSHSQYNTKSKKRSNS